MKHLIIIGVGGYAREVYWHAQGSIGYGEEWDVKGFLDGDIKLPEKEYKKLPLPLLGEVGKYPVEDDDIFICAIASPVGRKKLVEIMLSCGAKFINLIHKTAIIHDTAKIGIGNIIGHFTTIHDLSVIGNYVILNGRDGIGHDAVVGDYSSLMGVVSINGYAVVGKRTFWGTNSVAMAHSKIEDDAYVGVASVVFKRVKKGQRVFGNPAMPL
ncbi:acetyltransferase [Selenomonas ruminantium]|uniref:Sugar O-acyltransferase, sialic acid O-acetyltransferase NeuD family n=1 Tax=Selenomonas ruminantium TaxID=971 RepID=A0A1H0S174_SELRU|nr:acetyltransferase [Selenomonas ruminantium]SDP35463.1 sugar O-acyltransferase, sialic acid O-acetyltransferase NeuD family [Selenomonas ruminantium]